MKVQNVVNTNGNTVPNQFIITDGSRVAFQSYDSLIAEYDREAGKMELHSEWDYSRTTLKYFKQFIEDETPFIYDTKAKFEKYLDELVKAGKIVLMY